MGQFGIGQPVPREEDPYLLRGRGRYVDDVRAVDLARGYFLRSPHAHARIRSIDVAAARAAEGVLLVLTGEDPEVTALGLQVPRMPRKRKDGSPGFSAPQPWLARGFVRFVGEAVAFVVAETIDQAKDAADLIEIDYEILPAIVSTEQAMEPGALAVWDACPDNVAFYQEWGTKAAVDAAIAKADHVVRHRMIINRITANSMEPRGCLAEYDTHDDRYIIRCTIQAPHRTKAALAGMLKVPETRIRVIAENVGGGFGMKGAIFPEYILVPVAARLLGRPVKWMCERSEGLLSDEHSRDNVVDAEFALDRNGTFLGLRIRTYAAIGAYHTSDRAAGPPLANVGCLAATYKTQAFHVEVFGVMSHTQLTGHYRGAGRPENAYMIETMIDLAARELGMDKVELRRRNTVPPEAMPYKTGLVYTVDSGDFPKNLDQCLHMADYAGFAKRREEARRRGKLRGIGVSNTLEATASGLLEHAEIRFDATGTLTLHMGTHDHGQGHATTFKQILFDKLGIDSDLVKFKYGDTDTTVTGTGTFGSRSVACGGGAITIAADKVVNHGKKLAAHLLEAAEADLVFDKGKFTVAGTDKSVGLIDVAKASFMPGRVPRGMEAGLFETGTYDGGAPTFPNGCHVCEVEIDEETGAIEIVRYNAVDEVGRAINPLLLEGQVHGGIVQAVGQALMEDIRYDPASGQLLTGSFMDYGMPRADDLPSFGMETNEVPCKTNPLGVKGAGEAGTVGALPAVMNAINDALAQAGVHYLQMPCTPMRIWEALNGAASSRNGV
ncbi:MAG TPA: xanthine dehydrogenase family protein molybdopterin-binding subunit [Stellaceae bacterium]|nr:xanthine dehydrogenase family protein molybdopterin-binding subunit [Stellaceae bacterium]